jgi:hypothetical protein
MLLGTTTGILMYLQITSEDKEKNNVSETLKKCYNIKTNPTH